MKTTTITIGRCIDEFYGWSAEEKQACVDYYGWHKADLTDSGCVALQLLVSIADDSGHVPCSMWSTIKDVVARELARTNRCL